MAETTNAAPETVTEAAAPSAESQEHAAKLKEFAHAMDSAGLRARVPSSMKYKGDASTQVDEASDPKPAAKPATPEKPKNPYEPPADLSQRKLAEGFAKLVRKEKELRRAEEERAQFLRERDSWTTRQKEEQGQIQKERESWLSEQKAKMEELALMDASPEKWLELYAKRRGMPTAEAYDRLLSARLNDGRLTADHVAADAKSELAKLQSELEALKKNQEAEKKAAEQKAAEAAERQRIADIVQRENYAFIKHVCDEEPTAYPMLMEEAKADPGAAAKKAQELAVFRARERGKPVTITEIAKEMEDQLQYIAWREKQAAGSEEPAPKTQAAAKAKVEKPKPTAKTEASPTEGAATEQAPAKPEMKPKSNGLRSSSGPRTLTNRVAARQSERSTLAPRNDNERLKLAVQAWGKGA